MRIETWDGRGSRRGVTVTLGRGIVGGCWGGCWGRSGKGPRPWTPCRAQAPAMAGGLEAEERGDVFAPAERRASGNGAAARIFSRRGHCSTVRDSRVVTPELGGGGGG
jgi:hypothetical protein